MNMENKNIEMLYKSNPTVAALNKVPGFDPLKLLRRTKSAGTDEPVLRLDLPYKKLWFRLANPKGRIRVNALRVTEQLAIYEAQIYLNCSDSQPVGSFTAQCTKDSVPDGRYIEAAQQMAVNEALSDAGYGIQFADVSMRPEDQRYGSEIPVTAVQAAQSTPAVQPVVTATPPAATVAAVMQAAQPVQPAEKQPVPTQTMTAMMQPTQPVQPAAQQPVLSKAMAAAVPGQTAMQTAPVVPVAPNAATAATVMAQEAPRAAVPVEMQSPRPSAPVQVAEASKVPTAAEPATAKPANTPVPAQTTETQIAQPIAPAAVPEATPMAAKASAPIPQENPSATETSVPAGENGSPYTQESPVNDILRVMTLEQALEVVVDNGVCNGWTLREVSAKRPASLKYYIFSYKGKNNILRAAAKLVFDSLTVQTAA